MRRPGQDNSLAQVNGVTLSAKGTRPPKGTPTYQTEETTP